jgi:hypothetical protein
MKMLAAEVVPEIPRPDDLKERVKPLISGILQRERTAVSDGTAIGFGDALEWVEPDYPNIAALAEEVITSGGFGALRQLHGRRLFKDRAQLIGCAIALVVIGFLFDHR